MRTRPVFFLAAFLLLLSCGIFADSSARRMPAPDGFIWPEPVRHIQIFGHDGFNIKLAEKGEFILTHHEQLGGTGGPCFSLFRREPDGKLHCLAQGFHGSLYLSQEPYNGMAQLLIYGRDGGGYGVWALFRYDGKKYELVRREAYDYRKKEMKITMNEKFVEKRTEKEIAYAALLYKIYQNAWRLIDPDQSAAEPYDDLKVFYPDKTAKQAHTFRLETPSFSVIVHPAAEKDDLLLKNGAGIRLKGITLEKLGLTDDLPSPAASR